MKFRLNTIDTLIIYKIDRKHAFVVQGITAECRLKNNFKVKTTQGMR